jgi:hypothetical protein
MRKLCMRAFRFVRYRVVWPVLSCEPAVVGCAVVGVVALDDSTEGVRLGLIDSLGGREDDVDRVDGGGSTLWMERKDCGLWSRDVVGGGKWEAFGNIRKLGKS